jgi:hypothetical protein
MSQRTTIQPAFQLGDLGFAEPRPSRRAIRHNSCLAALAPGPAPPFDRPQADPQGSSDVGVLLPSLETLPGL